MLWEDLILFDPVPRQDGLPCALLFALRARGTLYYARSRERAFGCYPSGCSTSKGRCLEQPCDPELPFRDRVRQPLVSIARTITACVFAYMGLP